jgi:hypothetical protein
MGLDLMKGVKVRERVRGRRGGGREGGATKVFNPLIYPLYLTTSDISEKTPSLMLSGANHLMGSLTTTCSSCLKYCLDVSMLSDRPKSATLITRLWSILKA